MLRSLNKPGDEITPVGRASANADEAAFEQAMLTRWPRLSGLGIALRLGITAVVFFGMWRAVQYRGATALSLLLPMAAEIPVAIVTGLLLATFVIGETDFRRQVWSGLRPWLVIGMGLLVWQAYKAQFDTGRFIAQMDQICSEAGEFITRSGLGWSMLVAALGFSGGAFNDIVAYRRNGPPFVYLGALNFGLRTFLMLIFGFWLTCIVFAFDFNRRHTALVMWIALLLAELLALWMPIVVQDKIRAARAAKSKRSPVRSSPTRKNSG